MLEWSPCYVLQRSAVFCVEYRHSFSDAPVAARLTVRRWMVAPAPPIASAFLALRKTLSDPSPRVGIGRNSSLSGIAATTRDPVGGRHGSLPSRRQGRAVDGPRPQPSALPLPAPYFADAAGERPNLRPKYPECPADTARTSFGPSDPEIDEPAARHVCATQPRSRETFPPTALAIRHPLGPFWFPPAPGVRWSTIGFGRPAPST
jgi:hypothetical protein